MNEYEIYVDGSCRSNTYGGWAAVIVRGKVKYVVSGCMIPCTNNELEYLAVLKALEHVEPLSKVKIYSDSQLVVGQLSGTYKVRSKRMKLLKQKIERLIEYKKLQVTYEWIPREQNKDANRLAQQESKKLKKIKNCKGDVR